MIISRTPYRISFFGGGTDYPAWYRLHGGAVLAATINQYCTLKCRLLPSTLESPQLLYSSSGTHAVDSIAALPTVNAILRQSGLSSGVELHHQSDLPVRSGLGSSSTMIVGLLNAAYSLQGHHVGKRELALESIQIEQELLGEVVGSQDQVMAAFGGLQHVRFDSEREFTTQEVDISPQRMSELNDHLMLFHTGISRTASHIARSYVETIHSRQKLLKEMHSLVDDGLQILTSCQDLSAFGELLDEGWRLKRSLSARVSSDQIDEYYSRARKAGASGGKLTGAGGGGFLLLFVPPVYQAAVKASLPDLIHVPFRFDLRGSQIVQRPQEAASEHGLEYIPKIKRDSKFIEANHVDEV